MLLSGVLRPERFFFIATLTSGGVQHCRKFAEGKLAEEETFLRLTLNKPLDSDAPWKKISVRPVLVGGRRGDGRRRERASGSLLPAQDVDYRVRDFA